MTHTLTHTGNGLYGNNGTKIAADLILLEQKLPESLGTQRRKDSHSAGKDEAGGWDLIGSSRSQ